MPEESGFCRACCHVVLACTESQRTTGMASAVVSGGVLSIFYFSVRPEYRNLGLRTELLFRLEAWGRERGATEAQWPAHVCGDPREGVYVKSLETAPVAVRKKRSPSAWEKSGICIQELDLERPVIASDDEDCPIGEGLRRSDGSPLGIVLPFGEGSPAGGVPPAGGEEPGFLRPEDVAALEQGAFRPVVYYAVTARTSECRVGCASGVLASDMLLVWDLEVNRAYRGRGLGTELLGRLEDLGRKLGATDAWQHPAAVELQAFMLKRGYCWTGPICEKSLENLPGTAWEPREGIVFESLRLLCFVPVWQHGTRLMTD